MRVSIKAALMSGLLFPGSGQIYLKRYMRGFIYISIVLMGFGFIIGSATVKALDMLEGIQRQGGHADITEISRMALASPDGFPSLYFEMGFCVIILCWLVSTIDAYRTAKKLERNL